MSWLDLILTPDDKKAKVPVPKEEVAILEPVEPIASTPEPIAPTVLSSDADDSAYVKTLEDALDNKSDASFNFLKFKKAVESLQTIISDEKTRYLSVFATNVAANGISVENLIKSGEDFLAVLDNENSEFAEYINSIIATQITSKEEELKKLSSTKDDIVAQITKLTEDLNKLSEDELSIKNNIQATQSAIEIKKNNYASALYKVQIRLKNVSANIIKYLSAKGA